MNTDKQELCINCRQRQDRAGDGTDTGSRLLALAPVLDVPEVPKHPHHQARGAFVEIGGVVQPAPAPRFSATPPDSPIPPLPHGEQGQEALRSWGINDERVDRLNQAGTLFAR